MNKQARKNTVTDTQDFTQGSIFTKLLQFMLPILGALVLQAMYGAVDLLIVGRFGSNAGISGVATGSGILNMATFVVTALASAVTVLSSRYLGAKQNQRIGKLIGSAIAFFLLLSAALTVLLVVFARPLAVLMQAPAEAVELTAQYIRICGFGFVFIVFYNLISSILRGLGDSRTPLLFVGIACVANILGDLLLIAVLHMNVAGAAIATVAAQAISVVLSLFVIRRQDLGFAFSRQDIRLSKETTAFLKIGAPLALQEFLTSISFLMLCAFINRLGLDASNGYGIAQKLTSFILLIPSALMQSMSAFVAQNVGAGKEERARRGMYYGMGIGAAIGLVIAVLVFFKGDVLSSLFSDNPQDIIRAHEYLRGFALEAAITCILFSFMGYFNGHSRSTFVMLQGLAQSFLVRLPVSYIMSIQPNASLTMIGLAAPSATVFGILLCTIYYRRMMKNERLSLPAETVKSSHYNPAVSIVITIGRSYGSGGRTVGRLVAQQLGIPCFDSSIITAAAENSGLSPEVLMAADEKADVLSQRYLVESPDTLHSMAHKAQSEAILRLAEGGGCVIVGRRADQVLQGREGLLTVFVSASAESRAARIVQRDGLSLEKARIQLRKVDKERAEYYNSLSGYGWGKAESYDLCLNTDQFGIEGAADIIVDAARRKEEKMPKS